MSNYIKSLIYQHFSIIELLRKICTCTSMIFNICWQQRGLRIYSVVYLIIKGPFISGGTFYYFSMTFFTSGKWSQMALKAMALRSTPFLKLLNLRDNSFGL